VRVAIVEDEAVVARRLERSIRAVLGERVTRVTLRKLPGPSTASGLRVMVWPTKDFISAGSSSASDLAQGAFTACVIFHWP